MSRRKGADLELIELQLDKRGEARFVLNFGRVPPEGVVVSWRHFDQSEAVVAALSESYRLYSCQATMAWFSVPWFFSASQSRVSDRQDGEPCDRSLSGSRKVRAGEITLRYIPEI